MEIYPINLSFDTFTKIEEQLSFKWVSKSWKYLGIEVLLNLKDLYKISFHKGFREQRANLISQVTLRYNWVDRINIVKTFKISFFSLRMLYIDIPKDDFGNGNRCSTILFGEINTTEFHPE